MRTTPPTPIAASPRDRPRYVPAALILGALALLFLWTPLSSAGHSTFLTVDVLQNNTLTQLWVDHRPRNLLLSDPFTEFVPWIEFARAELTNGRLPLWNPFNGAGAPLLANYQSAVFSVFTLPFYVLSLKAALLVAAFARLFLTGWFTYLFLRQLRLRELAALGGAIAFTYCGYNSLLISYPHTAVVAFLPAVLWCIEVILRRRRAARAGGVLARTAHWHALLCALLAGQCFAGHPETLYFCLVITALWALARLGELAWRERRTPGAVRAWAACGLRLLAVALLAALLAAPQLAPFLEYVAQSTRGTAAAAEQLTPLELSSWPRYVFPNLLGMPVDGGQLGPRLPAPNYEIANLGYCGATVLLLALLALRRALRDARTALLGLLLIAWALWAHHLPPFRQLGLLLPGGAQAPAYVSQVIGLFCVSVLAAFELDAVTRGAAERRWKAASVLCVACVALLAVFAPAALREAAAKAAEHNAAAHLLESCRTHILGMSALVVGATFAVAAGLVVRNASVRRALVAAGILGVFAQTGALFAEYQTTSPDALVYPATRATITLRRLVGDSTWLSITREGLPATANVMYGLRQAANYDALYVRHYDRWHALSCKPFNTWRAAMTANELTLSSLGVEFCGLRFPGVDAPDEENGVRMPHWSGGAEQLRFVGRAGGQLIHRFRGQHDGVRSLAYAQVFESDDASLAPSVQPSARARNTLVLSEAPPEGFAVRAAPGPRRAAAPELASSDSSRLENGGPRAPDSAAPQATRPRAAPQRPGTVRVLERLPMRWRVRAQLDEPRYLLFSQAWYPGWKARVDGREVPLVRANYAFAAIDAPAGEHEIVLSYEPASWRLGLALAACGALGLAALWLGMRSAEARSATA